MKQVFEINSNFTQGAEIVTPFNFYKDMFHKNSEAEIDQILTIF